MPRAQRGLRNLAKRLEAEGARRRLRMVAERRPPNRTMASGARSSPPGWLRAHTSGSSPRMEVGLVMMMGMRRSSDPARMASCTGISPSITSTTSARHVLHHKIGLNIAGTTFTLPSCTKAPYASPCFAHGESSNTHRYRLPEGTPCLRGAASLRYAETYRCDEAWRLHYPTCSLRNLQDARVSPLQKS